MELQIVSYTSGHQSVVEWGSRSETIETKWKIVFNIFMFSICFFVGRIQGSSVSPSSYPSQSPQGNLYKLIEINLTIKSQTMNKSDRIESHLSFKDKISLSIYKTTQYGTVFTIKGNHSYAIVNDWRRFQSCFRLSLCSLFVCVCVFVVAICAVLMYLFLKISKQAHLLNAM